MKKTVGLCDNSVLKIFYSRKYAVPRSSGNIRIGEKIWVCSVISVRKLQETEGVK